MVSSVADNAGQFTKRELAQTAPARDCQHLLANASDSKLAEALDQGDIQGMQVTAAHVSNATEIFGPNIDALKERTTERSEGTPIPLQDQQESRQHRQCMLISYLCSRSPTYTLKIAYQVTRAHPGQLPVQNRLQRISTSPQAISRVPPPTGCKKTRITGYISPWSSPKFCNYAICFHLLLLQSSDQFLVQ